MHEVDVVRIDEVNIGHCCAELFAYIVQCINMTMFLVYDITDTSPANNDIARGLSKALPRLNRLKLIDIKNVNMGSAGSNVFGAFNAPNLKVLILHDTGLSGAGASFVSALNRFPSLAFLSLLNTGLTNDESLAVLNTLPSSCPDIVRLSIYPAKFRYNEVRPVYELRKLISLLLHLETIGDWVTFLENFPQQTLKMIYIGGYIRIGNALNKFLAVLRTYTALRHLAFNEGVLDTLNEATIRTSMQIMGGILVVYPKDIEGYQAYLNQLHRLRKECMSS